MCTKNQALRILKEVYSACFELYDRKLTDAYLYGSYARGDFHEDSDVDILITVDMEHSELAKYRRRLASIASGLSLEHDVTVSLAAKPVEQFNRYANVLPYYTNVVREGIRYAT